MKAKMILLLGILVLSCDGSIFNRDQVSSEAILWSDADEVPSFKNCDSLSGEWARNQCFFQTIHFIFQEHLSKLEPLHNISSEEVLLIQLEISSEGQFSLISFECSDVLRKAFPNLNATLENTVATLPRALPATKTNIGFPVASQYRLPITFQPLN